MSFGLGTQLFFAGFKVGIYWEMIKISKGVGKPKSGRIKYQEGGVFSSFLLIKTFAIFCSCFSRYYSKREIPRIKFSDCLVDLNTMTYILEEF